MTPAELAEQLLDDGVLTTTISEGGEVAEVSWSPHALALIADAFVEVRLRAIEDVIHRIEDAPALLSWRRDNQFHSGIRYALAAIRGMPK